MIEATLAIITYDGKVLLGEKKTGDYGMGTVNGPGGKIEPGETARACVIRETREEIGIDLDPRRLKHRACITFYDDDRPDCRVQVFIVDSYTGTPTATPDMEPLFAPQDAIPFDRMLPSDRFWFTKVLCGESFNANVYGKDRGRTFYHIEFSAFDPF